MDYGRDEEDMEDDESVPRQVPELANAPVPNNMKTIRAFMVCGLLKTQEQFSDDACENCNFLDMVDNMKRVNSCTTSFFEGQAVIMDPRESWAAKWIRVDHCLPGVPVYAITVTGQLDREVEDVDLLHKKSLIIIIIISKSIDETDDEQNTNLITNENEQEKELTNMDDNDSNDNEIILSSRDNTNNVIILRDKELNDVEQPLVLINNNELGSSSATEIMQDEVLSEKEVVVVVIDETVNTYPITFGEAYNNDNNSTIKKSDTNGNNNYYFTLIADVLSNPDMLMRTLNNNDKVCASGSYFHFNDIGLTGCILY